jgi:hypothetical protein
MTGFFHVASSLIYSQHGLSNLNELERVTASRRDTDCDMAKCESGLPDEGAQIGANEERAAELARLEHWWKETGNPLYIWEALAKCLSNDGSEKSIPAFCREYLKETAVKLTLLQWGRDFRSAADPKPRIDAEQANRLAPAALGLGREGSKNMFARVVENQAVQRLALDEDRCGIVEAETRWQRRHRHLGKDRMASLRRLGRRLLILRSMQGQN